MDNIFLALDFPSWDEASQFINKNDLQGVPVKVGMELFYREGPHIIEKLKENGHKIFLDLKLHDIPNTVHHAMKSLSTLNIDIVNVHALGGSEMIKRAKEGLLSGKGNERTKLIGVTILTSHSEETVQSELQLQQSLHESAIHLAKVTRKSGADGVVCSVHEAKAIKEACGEEFLTVTPGIRLTDTDANDQKRIATPAFARTNGSDILVIGRSITAADNPLAAYNQAVKEWGHDS
ncbi:MAG TPA: orotidine-5'-phosphate decarboxylase [Bacillota bacterium]|nr:orotidine-5'-phosphate decarboxylase [Bacillota bacterium]